MGYSITCSKNFRETLVIDCPLCNGTGEVQLQERVDYQGKYASQTEINDPWLADLKKYCQQNKKIDIPPAYVLKLIEEIWTLTYISLAYAKEVQELRNGKIYGNSN